MSSTEAMYPQTSLHGNGSSCPWRIVRKGFNVEGLCKNIHCPAYNQMVIVNKGFGEYDFARVILEQHNLCPVCNEEIHPTKYGLNQCQWWYVEHYTMKTFPMNTVNDTYVLNDLNCEYTIIEIMALSLNYRISTQSLGTACPICLMSVEDGHEIADLNCSHTFHRTCIDQWLKSNQSMADTCPLCRQHIC
ncbi:unnamed protein product [Adineta steineri]|uniref:RING-type E3 ubiquitin transferase n=1 Tax=Adineta steineri TaxID=433720 RepID=A0A814MGC1_9BILA|nr:unnamed protein product [Adineta steineri]CAF3506829.1 unnamed protein product [Adineta steineri]